MEGTKSRNVEVKIKLYEYKFNTTSDIICDLIKEGKINETRVIYHVDTFYQSLNGRLKLREINQNRYELIWYDRNDKIGPKLSEYHKINITDITTYKDVLSNSNGIIGIVKNKRILYIYGQTRIHLDFILNLGHFVELEVVLTPNQSVEDGEKIAKEILSILKIENEPQISCAYIDLLIENQSTFTH